MKINISKINRLMVVLGVASLMSTAGAQTTNIILQTDFDGDAGEGNFNNNYGYCSAGSSAGASLAGNSESITAGVGVGGTYANSSSPNYTLLPSDSNWTNAMNQYNYAVLANGTQFGSPMTTITPTAVLGSLILSADIQVLGLLPQLTNADVFITKVQFFDSSLTNILFDFGGDVGFVGSNYVHIAVPLSSLSYGGGYPYNPADATHPITDFTNPAVVGSIAGFTIEFAVEGLPVGVIGGTGTNLISPPFGFTSTGVLNVDNIELIQTGNTVPTPTQEQLIWQANFDNTFPNVGGFGIHYRDGGIDNATGILSTNVGGGVGGSNSLEYTVDLSSWSNTPPGSYSGFGVGATEGPLPYTLSDTNKASYRVYLSAKVGGTSAGVTNVPGVMDLLFRAPSNSTQIVVFDLNPTMTFTTNWQSYVFNNMPIGVNNGGSQALFNQYISQVNQLSVQVVPQGSPNIATLFGYDANNTVDIDNIKVVQLVPGLPPVSVTNTAGQINVYWTDPATGGTAQLQSSTNVAGPYVNVPGEGSGANSPYTVPAGAAHQFFRTIWVP
jgi:hypothetical protein